MDRIFKDFTIHFRNPFKKKAAHVFHPDIDMPCWAAVPDRGPVCYLVILIRADDPDLAEITRRAVVRILINCGASLAYVPGSIVATFGRPPFDEAKSRADALATAEILQDRTCRNLKIVYGVAIKLRRVEMPRDCHDVPITGFVPVLPDSPQLPPQCLGMEYGEIRLIDL